MNGGSIRPPSEHFPEMNKNGINSFTRENLHGYVMRKMCDGQENVNEFVVQCSHKPDYFNDDSYVVGGAYVDTDPDEFLYLKIKCK